jgi:hypothetical protein
MADSTEGVRRLSLIAGGVGSFLCLVFIFLEDSFTPVYALHWLIAVAGLAVCFFVPFALVGVVAWVIRGFTGKNLGG